MTLYRNTFEKHDEFSANKTAINKFLLKMQSPTKNSSLNNENDENMSPNKKRPRKLEYTPNPLPIIHRPIQIKQEKS